MIFWDEGPSPELAERWATQATARQERDDGRATWYLSQRSDPPRCGDCGRRQATKVWHGHPRCDVCQPAVVTPIPPKAISHPPVRSVESACLWCGRTITHRPDRIRRYCDEACHRAQVQAIHAQSWAKNLEIPEIVRTRAATWWPYYQQGESCAQIGKRFGLGRETVRRTLLRAQYPLRQKDT